MWTRASLKSRAKVSMKPYYWVGVIVCLIAGLLGSEKSGGFRSGSSFVRNGTSYSGSGSSYSGSFNLNFFSFAAVALAVFFVIGLILLIYSIFVGNVISVGKHRFFIESRYRESSGGIGLLFSGFSSGHYLNIVKIMFLKGLYEFLWTLLLVIPGIYKSYEYYMIPYLLAENPGIDSSDVFRQSKEMMDGNKFPTWVLELSFIGWYLLGALACGIGMFFVNPYYEATLTELYLELKGYHIPSAGKDVYVDAMDVTQF